MSRAAWSCAECDTNNIAANDVCRICAAPRSTAGGAIQKQQVQRAQQTTERPVFAESRYAAPPAPVRLAGTGTKPVPAPPPLPAVPPPGFTLPRPVGPAPLPPRPAPLPPWPAPYRPPARGRRTGRRVVKWTLLVVAGLFLLGNLDKLTGMLPDPGASDTEAPAAACPPEVAQWLPNGGGGAVLEVAYTTPKHVITLCRTADGALHYDGHIQGAPVTAETHMSIPAVPTPTGYVAENGRYRYEIIGAEVVIFKDGVETSRYPLTRTGP